MRVGLIMRTTMAVLLGLAVLASPAVAQDATPLAEPSPAYVTTPNGTYPTDEPIPLAGLDGAFPSASVLGPDWVVFDVYEGDPVEGSGATRYNIDYTGGFGDRALVQIIPVASLRDARVVGTYADDIVESWTYSLGEATGQLDRSDLVALPAPIGCQAVNRTEGREPYTSYSVGVTVCTNDPMGIIILVITSGVLLRGTDNLRLHEASDYLAFQAVSAMAFDRSIQVRTPEAATPIA